MSQLVGTTCEIGSATYSTQTLDDIVHRHTLNKTANPLKIAIASAEKRDIMDQIIIIHIKINTFRASAYCFITIMFHTKRKRQRRVFILKSAEELIKKCAKIYFYVNLQIKFIIHHLISN